MAEASDSLEIIDLDDLNLEDDETWLVQAKTTEDHDKSWKKWNMSDDPEVRMKKRSLVEKLDFIAKGSPTRFYASRPSMSSTPLPSAPKFDPRTFTRRPSRNLTFDKDTNELLANLSGLEDNNECWKNSTFTRKTSRMSRESSEAIEDDRLSLASSDASSSHRLNDVGDVQNIARLQEESLRQGLNSTFTKNEISTPPNRRGSSGLNLTYQKLDLHNHSSSVMPNNATFEVKSARSSSQDIDLDDRLSSTSDSSMSHRLNDLGDVQNIARLQEESLRQAVMNTNHRSATVSPSSENSPSTEGGHHNHHHHRGNGGGPPGNGVGGGVSGGNYAQYSSQDSLPDSPYSSQSLDSQPATGQDRIGRSMPNLNKIRGQKTNCGPPPTSKGVLGRQGQANYGLSSRYHNSDPRMMGGHQQPQQPQYHGVPSRGTVMTSRDSSAGSSSGVRQPMRFQSGLRPPSSTTTSGSRIARPSTGIPRPPTGSRLPAPTSSGIPKPNSNPGSRASSASGRKSSYCY